VSHAPVRAVLLDALGTLVELEPPAPRLRGLLARAGFEVSEERAARAFAAEIEYYLEHHLEGADRDSLDDLRRRCAAVLARELELPELGLARARELMLKSFEFRAYPDCAPALRALRERGVRLVVASNWDCSLSARLADAGLEPLVDGVVSSAQVGEAKPGAAVFRRALELAGAAPSEALHVGDSLANDVEGARAAGIRAVLVDRTGGGPAPGVETLASLAGLPDRI